MAYPASPSDVEASRGRPDAARFWAGGVATAVVAALVALVGILICRWTLNIPILAPKGAGAWGNAHTAEYALVAALIALIAGGALYLLLLGTPQPHLFFDWILGLATLAAVMYPFSTSAPFEQKAATSVVNLVLGIAITTLLTAVAARAIRRPAPPRPPYDGYDGYQGGDAYRRQHVPDQRYGPEQGEGYGEYPRHLDGPTRPVNVPQRRYPRR